MPPADSTAQPETSRRERIVTELSPPPDASSTRRPWRGMTVQLHDWRAAGSIVSPAVDHDFLAMRYTGVVHLEQRRLGKVHRAFAVPGNVTLHPRGFESRWSWDRPGAIVVARIPQYLLSEAADATLHRVTSQVQLRNCFGGRDEFIEPELILLARELQQPVHPVQELITEHLSCALAGYLVARFNVRKTPLLSDPAGLSPQALRRVLDYMHSNIAESISLQQLADIAGVSRFHFARMFRRSMGDSPMAYVGRRRLLHAQELLRTGRITLAQVAAAAGYADQAHFTRRFRRAFACTPAVYARHHAAVRHFPQS